MGLQDGRPVPRTHQPQGPGTGDECRGFPNSGIAVTARRAATPSRSTIDDIVNTPSGRQALGYRSVESVDGTRLRAWSNEGRGVPVVISNGLGTPHDAWPTINRRGDIYRVVTWDHRGLGGSDRPSDESRITISDHTDDLFAVMDSYGIDRAVVIGWSAGVNIAFEAAVRDQRRVAGVLAIGGVPGGTFEALLHPLPRFLRTRAGRLGSHLMRYLGPVLNRLGDGLSGSSEHGFDPRGVATFGLDVVHGQTLVRVLRRFADHDWPWYSRLARAVGDHPPDGPERYRHASHLCRRDVGLDHIGRTDAGGQHADTTESIRRTPRDAFCAAATSQPRVNRARQPR